jgi:hypothetical protein
MPTIEVQPRVTAVNVVDDKLSVIVADGRTLLVPIEWYPRLSHATQAERADWQIFEDSDGRDIIFWKQLDELIPVLALITGTSSRELDLYVSDSIYCYI